MLNESIRYQNGVLHVDDVPVPDIDMDTPVYIYSLRRVLQNYAMIRSAFSSLKPQIHYSAKANANLTLMRMLVSAGLGIDAVSMGEIVRALAAGCNPENVVFAGVGKTEEELRYAVEQQVGWFNVENVDECRMLDDIAREQHKTPRVALRYNPDVQANTHPGIATGHGAAKFGMSRDDIQHILFNSDNYSSLRIEGIHIHVGSQLADTSATVQAVASALEIITDHKTVNTVNIGGGFPVPYTDGKKLPTVQAFADAIKPLLAGYRVLLEPGRAIVADAGLLLTQVLYVKEQGGKTFYIVDGSMTELMRPALYGAQHQIVPVREPAPVGDTQTVTVVGPVCETTDVLAKDIQLPVMERGDMLAILDAGAYGMVMSSNYNQRPRPAELIVDGDLWLVARRRETFEDMMRGEIDEMTAR